MTEDDPPAQEAPTSPSPRGAPGSAGGGSEPRNRPAAARSSRASRRESVEQLRRIQLPSSPGKLPFSFLQSIFPLSIRPLFNFSAD